MLYKHIPVIYLLVAVKSHYHQEREERENNNNVNLYGLLVCIRNPI